ncbi:MAG: M23 family metallopeptidase [bacterium]
MQNRLFLKIYLILIFSLGGITVLHSQDLLWPTDASRLITSTFCEFRPGHFHAGIDIKTWARSGYKIFAVEDGSIIRIKTSPYGYGRAVYLKLDNGLTAVYAHLSDFSPRIKTVVLQEQNRIDRYSINKYLPEGELRVRKGEILGYTGRSGTDVPHLHFEIRDINNNPINPFMAGFTIKDSISPTINALAVTPLNSGSTVNGDFVTQIIPVDYRGKNHYFLTDTVFCNGEICFSLAAYDRADGAYNRFTPYRLALFIDNTLIFSTKYDSLSFEQTRQIFLDRDYRLMKLGRGYFHNLYRSQGNTLDFYYFKGIRTGVVHCTEQQLPHNKRVTVEDDGSVILSPGLYKIKIIVSDYYNNTSALSGCLNISERPNFPHKFVYNPDTSETGFYTEFIEDYLYCSLPLEESLSDIPVVTVELHPWKSVSIPLIKNINGFSGQLPLDDYSGLLIIKADWADYRESFSFIDTVFIHSINKYSSFILPSRDTVCNVHFQQNSLYHSIKGYCKISKLDHPDCIYGYQYQVYPQTVPLKNPVKVEFNISLGAKVQNKAAIYSIKEGEFSFIGNRWEENVISGWSNKLGNFTLLQDTIAPEIDYVKPASEGTITTAFPVIEVGFSDSLSGIAGEDCYIIRVDGKKKIVEYDPERDRCYCPIREPLTSGIHFLEIMVKDRVDNVIRWKGWFSVDDSEKT